MSEERWVVRRMVDGGRWMVNGTWYMVHGTWWMVNGEWWMVNGEWWMVDGGCELVRVEYTYHHLQPQIFVFFSSCFRILLHSARHIHLHLQAKDNIRWLVDKWEKWRMYLIGVTSLLLPLKNIPQFSYSLVGSLLWLLPLLSLCWCHGGPRGAVGVMRGVEEGEECFGANAAC